MTPEPVQRQRVPDVASVDARLAECWRQAASESEAVMRACTLNLVVACPDRADVAEATRVLAGVSEQHPGRAVVLSSESAGPAAGGPTGLEAFVSTHCHRTTGGKQVCSEQVTLEATGPEAAELLPETVLQLLVGDVPVYVWWRRPTLGGGLFERLTRVADRVVADSALLGEPGPGLGGLAALASDDAKRSGVGDLAWVRLEPWRELVASLFDSASTRGYLDALTAVRVRAGVAPGVRGAPVAGVYLAGWLASRLGWRHAGGPRYATSAGRAVDVGLEAAAEARPGAVESIRLEAPGAVFALEAVRGSELGVHVEVEMEASCPVPRTHRLSRLDETALLCGEIERVGDDPVFESALALAAELAAPSPG